MLDTIINLFKWIWRTITCHSECHNNKCCNSCENDCVCDCNQKDNIKIKEPQNKSLKEVSN